MQGMLVYNQIPMARSEYTSRRRLMMQIVVWVVFAASIALAAGVVQWKDARTRVQLAPPQTLGGLEIRLPQGWAMKVRSLPGSHIIRCDEQVPDGASGRTLIVLRQSLRSEIDPLEFLMTNVLSDENADAGDAEWIDVDGQKGVVLQYLQQIRVGRAIHSELQTAACVMLQGGNMVVIQYAGHGDPNGKQLIRQIAQSLHAIDDASESAPSRRPLPGSGAV